MRKVFIPLLLLLGVSLRLAAQTPKDIMKEPIPVAMFQVTYAFQLPGFDTREMYGITHNVGGGFAYKTESNWLFAGHANFIVGGKVKGDRTDIFGEGITTVNGEIIGGAGNVALLDVNQRGFHIQAEMGKLFPMGTNPNSGLFVQGGLGYLRNRLRVDFQQSLLNPPYQVEGDYQYGYDRMRGGPAVHLSTGYLYLSDSRLINFSVALEVTYARTRDLRDYDFRVFTNPETGQLEPVGRTDPNKRYNDFYYGIRFTWSIPTYERKPDDFYYN